MTIEMNWDDEYQAACTLSDLQEAVAFRAPIAIRWALINEARGWGATEAQIRAAKRNGYELRAA